MLSDRCLSLLLSVLSVTLVYCGETIGCIKVKHGMDVCFGSTPPEMFTLLHCTCRRAAQHRFRFRRVKKLLLLENPFGTWASTLTRICVYADTRTKNGFAVVCCSQTAPSDSPIPGVDHIPDASRHAGPLSVRHGNGVLYAATQKRSSFGFI